MYKPASAPHCSECEKKAQEKSHSTCDNSDVDNLVSVIKKLQENIGRARAAISANETRTRNALIDPLLKALGWDPANPELVTTEYSLGFGYRPQRVDYALHPQGQRGQPIAFIEAKRMRQDLNDEHRDQALKYANRRKSAEYACLTNGDTWEFYKVSQETPPRLILKLSILSDPACDCAAQLLEINAALKDPQKRAQYDRRNPPGGNTRISADASSRGAGAIRTPQNGGDLRIPLSVSFEEARFGAEKEVDVYPLGICSRCSGSKRHTVKCSHCNGAGCTLCNGVGEFLIGSCPQCDSSGRERLHRKLKITIPPGTQDGTPMRLAAAGDAGIDGGSTGDLYVTFLVRPRVESEANGPRVEAEANGPRVETEANGPRVETEANGPRVETEANGPRVETEANGPRVETEANGPRVETEANGPRVETEARGLRWAIVGLIVSIIGVGGVIGVLGYANSDGPAQSSQPVPSPTPGSGQALTPPTSIPTSVPTLLPTPTATSNPIPVPVLIPTHPPIPVHTPTPPPTPIPIPTPIPTPTYTPSPTPTPTPPPTLAPTPTPTPTSTPTPGPTPVITIQIFGSDVPVSELGNALTGSGISAGKFRITGTPILWADNKISFGFEKLGPSYSIKDVLYIGEEPQEGVSIAGLKLTAVWKTAESFDDNVYEIRTRYNLVPAPTLADSWVDAPESFRFTFTVPPDLGDELRATRAPLRMIIVALAPDSDPHTFNITIPFAKSLMEFPL